MSYKEMPAQAQVKGAIIRLKNLNKPTGETTKTLGVPKSILPQRGRLIFVEVYRQETPSFKERGFTTTGSTSRTGRPG